VWGRRQVFYNKEIPVPREGDEIKETISSWALTCEPGLDVVF
jgi:hypothetical protein